MGSIQFDYYLHFKSLWQLKTQSFLLWEGRWYSQIVSILATFTLLDCSRTTEFPRPTGQPPKVNFSRKVGKSYANFENVCTYLSGTPAPSRPRRRHADFFKWLSKHFFLLWTLHAVYCFLQTCDSHVEYLKTDGNCHWSMYVSDDCESSGSIGGCVTHVGP